MCVILTVRVNNRWIEHVHYIETRGNLTPPTVSNTSSTARAWRKGSRKLTNGLSYVERYVPRLSNSFRTKYSDMDKLNFIEK